MPTPNIPPGATELEFDIQEEQWNEYEVENGQVLLRGRTILMRLYQAGDQYAFNAQTIVSTKALRDDLKGTPTPNLNEQLATAKKQRRHFEAIREPWNVYRTRGPEPIVLRTRMVASGVERFLGLFDALGEPVYQVFSQVVIAPPTQDDNPVQA